MDTPLGHGHYLSATNHIPPHLIDAIQCLALWYSFYERYDWSSLPLLLHPSIPLTFPYISYTPPPPPHPPLLSVSPQVYSFVSADSTTTDSDFNLSGLHNSYATRFPDYVSKAQCPEDQSITFVTLASICVAITVILFFVFALA